MDFTEILDKLGIEYHISADENQIFTSNDQGLITYNKEQKSVSFTVTQHNGNDAAHVAGLFYQLTHPDVKFIVMGKIVDDKLQTTFTAREVGELLGFKPVMYYITHLGIFADTAGMDPDTALEFFKSQYFNESDVIHRSTQEEPYRILVTFERVEVEHE